MKREKQRPTTRRTKNGSRKAKLTGSRRERPSFKNPPVIEVICGIQFQTLALMQAPHLGLFWQQVRRKFPRTHSVPPIGNPVDLSGNQPVEVVLQLGGVALPRVWFLTSDESALIQVQQDRFLYNWKQVAPHRPYPRYPAVVNEFRTLFQRFVAFTKKNELGEIVPTQLELTYVNHIPPEHGWSSLSEVGQFFPDFLWRGDARYLPVPEALNWKTQFIMSEEGRLHASLQSARRRDDPQKELLRFDLTARGLPAKFSDAHIRRWYDKANEWIVDGFIDLTAKPIQETVWGRQR